MYSFGCLVLSDCLLYQPYILLLFSVVTWGHEEVVLFSNFFAVSETLFCFFCWHYVYSYGAIFSSQHSMLQPAFLPAHTHLQLRQMWINTIFHILVFSSCNIAYFLCLLNLAISANHMPWLLLVKAGNIFLCWVNVGFPFAINNNFVLKGVSVSLLMCSTHISRW
jgi:hypothetical protein